MNAETVELARQIFALQEQVRRLESQEYATGQWTYLTAPLTSTSWDGDAYSTTAKTKIDLSAVFAVPAGVKAVLVRLACRDSASASSVNVRLAISGASDANEALIARPAGLPNDYFAEAFGAVGCDANGDIYYLTNASGSLTLDCYIQIWGYYMGL